MKPERWRQLEQLCAAALERKPDERAAYLAQACADDASLRQEAESILAQEHNVKSFLEESPLQAFARQASAEDDDPANSHNDSLAGRTLGNYHFIAKIGEGGMGKVYRAKDTKLGREVAIKVLPPEFVKDAERLSRFRREAKLLASLNHPNIATIHGLEDSGAIHFLVMELVEGQNLSERGVRGPLPVAEALKTGQQIAEALDHAHERKVIHRDLKPANVIVKSSGRVKVLDFGLAKALAEEDANSSHGPTVSVLPTAAGWIMGTPAYMSPEQAQGQPVDKQTDIWAFGCVLYEMLTGRRCFRGENVSQTLAAVLRSEPDWNVLPAETPPTICTLLRRCLQKDQSRRLHSAADIALTLEDSLSTSEGMPAVEAGSTRPRWHLRERIAWVSVVLCVAALAIVAYLYQTKSTPASEVLQATADTVSSQLTNYGRAEQSGALAPDGRSFAFVSNHDGNFDIWVRQVSGGEPVRLTNDGAVERDLVYSHDGETIYYVRPEETVAAIWSIGALGGQPRRVISKARMPAPSPDGRALVYLTAPNPASLEMISLDGSDKKVLVPDLPPGDPFPTWSPNGRWLAYTEPGLFTPHNAFLVDVNSGQTRQITHYTASSQGIFNQAWLPDSRHLVVSYVPTPGQLFSEVLGILDIEGGSVSRLTLQQGQRFGSVSTSADGGRLLATVIEDRYEVWKVPLTGDAEANGKAAARLLDAQYNPFWTFVSRDGRTLLFNGLFTGNRNLWIMPLDLTSGFRQVTMMEGTSIMHSSLSPDGTRVAFAASASGNSDIWTQNVDGSDLRQLTNDAPNDYWPAWSPDGRQIVFGKDVAGSRDTWVIPASGGAAQKWMGGFFRGDLREKPDRSGTLLVSSKLETGIRLVDFEARKVLWETHMNGTSLSLPTFTPDGKHISLPVQDSDNRTSIWIYDTATGASRISAKFPESSQTYFRAGWTDSQNELIINRGWENSHVVLFDRFWTRAKEP